MRTLIIDRFEGSYAICEENKEFFGIALDEMPQGAKEGDVLVISDDGELKIDQAQTKARNEKLKSKTGKLFK